MPAARPRRSSRPPRRHSPRSPRHREHYGVTVSVNRRSRARNVRFYVLILSVVFMFILSDREHPALPEHDRVLVETVDLQRWVLAADPGSSAWIHPTTGSPCAPLPNSALVSTCVESSATTASAHGPERAPIGRTKHSSRCGRSIVHPSRRRGSARSIRSSATCEVRSGLLPGSGGPQDVDQRSLCPPAHGAQNAQIWTASVVMGIEPTPAQIESSLRLLSSGGRVFL